MTVPEFCARYDISKHFFYDLIEQGIGPDTMKLGKRRLISMRAAEKWERKCERRTRKLKH